MPIKHEVIYQFSDKHIAELNALYQMEWWTKGRTLEETKKCLNGSQVNIGIVDQQDSLLAYARVLTDYTFKAIIFDVIVAKEARSTGLGDKLLHLIITHGSLKNVVSFELYCLPEMMPFYQKHGFSDEVGGVKLMRTDPNGRLSS
ncbi:MAG: GNAT family N-acetyltransferase [Aestuariibacter sp.]